MSRITQVGRVMVPPQWRAVGEKFGNMPRLRMAGVLRRGIGSEVPD